MPVRLALRNTLTGENSEPSAGSSATSEMLNSSPPVSMRTFSSSTVGTGWNATCTLATRTGRPRFFDNAAWISGK